MAIYGGGTEALPTLVTRVHTPVAHGLCQGTMRTREIAGECRIMRVKICLNQFYETLGYYAKLFT